MSRDVLVIGAGPTGLMLGCELAPGGGQAVIVDRVGGEACLLGFLGHPADTTGGGAAAPVRHAVTAGVTPNIACGGR